MKTWGIFAYHVLGMGVPQSRVIVAAPSRAAAARAFGVSSQWLDKWGSEFENATETPIVLAEPGVVFARALDDHHGSFRRAVLNEHGNLTVESDRG